MTPEEKATQIQQRNAQIVAYYQAGHKLSETASHFQLGRQRILQILQAAGAWRPYVKGDRTRFVGVNVSEQTKDALAAQAKARGTSVSRLASDALDAVVAEETS